jgi:hypothetical protein
MDWLPYFALGMLVVTFGGMGVFALSADYFHEKRKKNRKSHQQ